MNCTACGREFPDGAAFCPECGAAKVGMDAAPGMTKAPASPGLESESGKESGGGALGRAWAVLRSTLTK